MSNNLSLPISDFTNNRISYSMDETAIATGLGKTTLYALIKDGKLPAVRLGRRTLIRADDLNRLLTSSTEPVSQRRPCHTRPPRIDHREPLTRPPVSQPAPENESSQVGASPAMQTFTPPPSPTTADVVAILKIMDGMEPIPASIRHGPIMDLLDEEYRRRKEAETIYWSRNREASH